MSISSINIQTAKASSKAHMSRDKNHKITYLLDPSSKENEYKSFQDAEKYLEAAKVAAKKLTGRKMQQKAIEHFIQEALLNVEKFHTVDDVEKVFIELKKEFGGFEIFDIAIHRDEGYFYNLQEDLEYRPNRDIFFNDQDEKFYLDKNFKNSVDLNQFDMTTGKNPRLQKSDMSKIQTITAKALGMQRGELFSKAKRMSHWQLKKGYDLKRDEKKSKNEALAKQKDLKKIVAQLRAELKEHQAVRADYAKLEQVNKELKEKIKQKELTAQELEEKINLWRHEAINWQEGKKYKELYEELKEENEELKEELKSQVSPYQADENKTTLREIFKEVNEHKWVFGTFEDKILEREAEQTDQFNSAWIFKTAYETKGEQGTREEKVNWLEKEVIPTVTFDVADLEQVYQDLKTHDSKRKEQFNKALKLFRNIEKSFSKIFNFIKEKIKPNQPRTELEEIEQSLIDFVNEEEKTPIRGFRR